MPGYSEQLAQWCAGLKFTDLPADVVASTRLRVLDVIGLALAAVPLPTGKSVRAAALAMGKGDDARILGTGDRVPAMQAALANGTMAQAQRTRNPHQQPDSGHRARGRRNDEGERRTADHCRRRGQ